MELLNTIDQIKKKGRPKKREDEVAIKRILVGLTSSEIEMAEVIRKENSHSMAQHIHSYYLLGLKYRNQENESSAKKEDSSKILKNIIHRADKERKIS